MNRLQGASPAPSPTRHQIRQSVRQRNTNFARDIRDNGGMPSMIEPGAFEVGRDLAVTPGAVVARDAVAEVLRYAPATDTVF